MRFMIVVKATAESEAGAGAEMRLLQSRGVVFRGEPQNMGPIMAVMLEDGCGNLIHLVQPL